MKRVAAACFVGSAVEFYDFHVYGTAAALVFPTVFFPHLSPGLAAPASIGTFVTAFVSRPLGAVAFGHLGDRLGRKKTLVATLLIMALSTVMVGLVPTTATIGVAAPLILIVLRLLQGLAFGGEWAGSALLSAEYAPTSKRGRYGMFTPLGGGAGFLLASLTFLGVNFAIGEHSTAFMQWGVAPTISDQRGADRHRSVCAAQHRGDPGVRRGKSLPPGFPKRRWQSC